MRIRVKFGKNLYSNQFTCSFCRQEFDDGGFFLRVEHEGAMVDVPICPTCFDSGATFEGLVDLSAHDAAHPIGRA